MKTSKKILSFCAAMLVGLFFLPSVALGQSDGKTQMVSFKVYGVCGDCKERIESTAKDVKGVKKAEWDVQTDMLVLVGSKKMDKQNVAAALAKAGHKSELVPVADPKGYANLPACCQYDSGAEKH